MSDGLELLELRDGDDGHTAAVHVAPGSPWFAGHFPGEPVLPAMAQIGLVDRLFRRTGGAAAPTALPNLRLAGPILPGDRLTLHLARPDGAGRASFRLDKGDETVSRGSMGWRKAPPAGDPEPAEDHSGGRGEELRPPSSTLLPHRPPALLAERVLRVTPGRILCRGAVPADNASVRDGRCGPWMALELAAQAAGLLQAAAAGRGGTEAEPRVGYIVRIRNARFHQPSLPAVTPLVARVDHDGGGGPLTLYRVRVELEGAPAATGTLGTFVPPG